MMDNLQKVIAMITREDNAVHGTLDGYVVRFNPEFARKLRNEALTTQSAESLGNMIMGLPFEIGFDNEPDMQLIHTKSYSKDGV